MKKTFLSNVLLLSLLSGTILPINAVLAEDTSTETTSVEESTNDESTSSQSEETVPSTDWDAISAQLKANLEAETIKTKYVQTEPLVLETNNEEIIVTLHGYAYYEITDFDQDYEITFGDQDDHGGVIVYDISFENKTDEDIYPVASFNTKVTGDSDYINKLQDPLDNPGLNKLLVDNDQKVNAGDSIRGLVAMAVKPTTLEKLDAEGFAMLETPTIYSQKEFDKDALLVKGAEIRVPFSIDGAKTISEAGAFYADKYTAENWGTKTMIKEEQPNQTIESEGLSITLAGYQLTKLEPNVDYESRFADFKDGAYLLTVNLNFENNSDEDMTLSSLSGTITLADMVYYFNEGLLQVSQGTDAIVAKGGGTGQYYQTYLFDGATYDKFAEDKWVVEVKPQTTDYDRLGEKDTFFFTIQE